MNFKLTGLAAMLLLSLGLYAQPMPQNFGPGPGRPEMKSPETLAKEQADMMRAEVGINDKQYKKVYKLLKSDFEYRQGTRQESFGGQFPMGGPGMGPGGPGGPGMGGPGGPGMGGPGMGGGRPPQGFSPNGEGFGPPPGFNTVDEQYIEKQEKKLRKILTEEQYNQWRAKHPAERQELPPVDFKW